MMKRKRGKAIMSPIGVKTVADRTWGSRLLCNKAVSFFRELPGPSRYELIKIVVK